MNDLKVILDSIIKGAFPELLAEDIKIEYKKLKDAMFEYGMLSYEGAYIEVDKSLKDAPINVLIGGIVHELAHILTDIKIGKNQSIKDRLAYKISTRYKTLDERNTDLEVILRGYGKELFEFLIYSEKTGYDHYKEDGLSIRELKILLNVL
jgi:hypothetical protein